MSTSSTEIREVIARYPVENSRKRLEGSVLNAEILVRFVQDARGLPRQGQYFL